MGKELGKPAGIITLCRLALSVSLIFLSPKSVPFGVIYLLCGISDIADGFVARKTHTESDMGARLDSTADIVFFAVSAVKLLPLMRLGALIWIWAAVIAVIKIAAMLMNFSRYRSIKIPHSAANKLTGVLLFILPVTIPAAEIRCFAAVVCMAATFAAVQDILIIKSEIDYDIENRKTDNSRCVR